jgi:hypothetical protein
MPHILDPDGNPIEDSIPECFQEQFALSEQVHTNIEAGTYTGEKLNKANALENHWKEVALHTLKTVEKISADYEKFLA